MNVSGTHDYVSKRRTDVNVDSVKQFVKLYKRHKLWDTIAKRKHGAFPLIANVIYVKNPRKLGARLNGYSKEMSKEHRMYVFK